MTHQELIQQLPRMIDISGVRTDVTVDEIKRIAKVAKHYGVICTFAMPYFTKMLVDMLADRPDILVGGTIGFPSGADTTSLKVQNAKEQILAGCDELDMVINVGALKSGMYDAVYEDIKAVVDASEDKPTKCILEIAYLTDDEIKRGSELAVKAGIDFVKSGTGWANKPTTVETIKLIKSTIGDSAKIKAAGGVRDLDTILAMCDEGCSRFGIGLRSIMSIMKEADARLGRVDDFTLETASNDQY